MIRKSPRFIRLPEVEKKTGLGHSRIYVLEKQGRFPRRIKISDRAVAWLETDIEDWMEKRMAQSVA
jgi:prophage regulatory protein